jgi:hypothetical protein
MKKLVVTIVICVVASTMLGLAACSAGNEQPESVATSAADLLIDGSCGVIPPVGTPATPPVTPVTLVAAKNAWIDISVDNNNVYWDTNTNSVLACSINGCSAPTTVYTATSGNMTGLLASGCTSNVFSIASDPDNAVYLGSTVKGSWQKTDKLLNLYSAGGLVYDSLRQRLYTVQSGATISLMGMNPDGSQLTNVIGNIRPNFGASFYLGIDSAYVYVPDTLNNRVVYCALGGDCSGGGKLSFNGISNPRAAYSDGTYVWAIASGNGTTGAIYRCPVGTFCGAPQPFATSQSSPWAVVSDSKFVYWTNNSAHGQIMRCPVAGCPASGPTPFVTGISYPYALTHDTNYLYFIDSVGIRKAHK